METNKHLLEKDLQMRCHYKISKKTKVGCHTKYYQKHLNLFGINLSNNNFFVVVVAFFLFLLFFSKNTVWRREKKKRTAMIRRIKTKREAQIVKKREAALRQKTETCCTQPQNQRTQIRIQ